MANATRAHALALRDYIVEHHGGSILGCDYGTTFLRDHPGHAGVKTKDLCKQHPDVLERFGEGIGCGIRACGHFSGGATWKSSVDAQTGRTYYYNSVTRATSWTKPAELTTKAKRDSDVSSTANTATAPPKKKRTVVELKAELVARDLDTTGKKKVLVARLEAADDAAAGSPPAAEATADAAPVAEAEATLKAIRIVELKVGSGKPPPPTPYQSVTTLEDFDACLDAMAGAGEVVLALDTNGGPDAFALVQVALCVASAVPFRIDLFELERSIEHSALCECVQRLLTAPGPLKLIHDCHDTARLLSSHFGATDLVGVLDVQLVHEMWTAKHQDDGVAQFASSFADVLKAHALDCLHSPQSRPGERTGALLKGWRGDDGFRAAIDAIGDGALEVLKRASTARWRSAAAATDGGRSIGFDAKHRLRSGELMRALSARDLDLNGEIDSNSDKLCPDNLNGTGEIDSNPDTSGGGGGIVLEGHVCQQRRRLGAVVWKKLWMVVTSTNVSIYKKADMATRHYTFSRGSVRAELVDTGLVLHPAGEEAVHLRAAEDGPASGDWFVAVGSSLGTEPSVDTDLKSLLALLPPETSALLEAEPNNELRDIVFDLGRPAHAIFSSHSQSNRVVALGAAPVTRQQLVDLTCGLEFGPDNRSGIDGCLHRISAMRNLQHVIYGVTMRVGRSVTGNVERARDVLLGSTGRSVLVLGGPGSGKTTIIREVCQTLAEDGRNNVVIIDTSNEIAGDGDLPHASVGLARRMMVPDLPAQARVMVEALQNHTPDVIVVDEIGRSPEVEAARTVKQRGVRLFGSAHGDLRSLVKNAPLRGLIGGVTTVTLGDEEAKRSNQGSKQRAERGGAPVFDVVIEITAGEFNSWRVVTDVAAAVDAILRGDKYDYQHRIRRPDGDLRLVLGRG